MKLQTMAGLCVLLATVGVAEAGTIYRCDTAVGAVYADVSCGRQARTVAVRQATVVRAVAERQVHRGRTQAASHPDRPGRDEADRIRRAMIRDRAAPGMSRAQLRFALGEPARIRVTTRAGRRVERWRFETAEAVQTVRIVGDRVVSVRGTSR